MGIVIGHISTKYMLTQTGKEESQVPTDPPKTLILAKNFTIPIVDAEEVSLDEMVDYLRTRTRTGIETESRPPRLNFIVIDPEDRARPITLQLRKIRLDRLCTHIAELSGVDVSFEEDSIIFRASK